MTLCDRDRLRDLHDAAADDACIWRRLQGLLAEQREEFLLTASDRLAAVCAFQSAMVELCMREGAAMGTMLRIREQLGCRPAPRRTDTVSA